MIFSSGEMLTKHTHTNNVGTIIIIYISVSVYVECCSSHFLVCSETVHIFNEFDALCVCTVHVGVFFHFRFQFASFNIQMIVRFDTELRMPARKKARKLHCYYADYTSDCK